MKRRIFGLENEYGLIFSPVNKKSIPMERLLEYIFERIIDENIYPNTFLVNGARFYLDIGCHPEYATPECDNIFELIAHDKAGEYLIESCISIGEERLEEVGYVGSISIFKNNSDSVGNTYGCHENYLIERRRDFLRFARQLIPFFVTRQIFTGSGRVVKGGGKVHYNISQRSPYIQREVSSSTTSLRSIINTRDEPHADPWKYRRLHIIVGDSNMSEYSTYLKVGTTLLILDMVEDGFYIKNMDLENPVAAIKDISYDISLKKKVRLVDGREFTAIEIQKEYFEKVYEYYSKRGMDSTIEDIVKNWWYVISKLEEDPMELSREIDWVIKLNFILSYMRRKKCSWDDPRVSMIDLQYHNVDRNKGIYYLLEREGLVRRVISDEDISRSKTTPPKDTRGYFRGMCVNRFCENVYAVSWSSIIFDLKNDSLKKILLLEPLKGSEILTKKIFERSSSIEDLLKEISN